jgi:arabinose-5-phosphate isomerase
MSQGHLAEIQQLLRIESEAIAQTATRLDQVQVERVVELLAQCKGKVVILGVGKSGIIGQKIAATMTSAGTAALYLHPSDALHGSLGIVQADDVVIVLSNSGETDEIVAMLPYLKNRSVPIVAVVGNLNSTLARRSDAVLDASVDQEACPLNLAPTTSTTVALAIGDALAMTVMKVFCGESSRRTVREEIDAASRRSDAPRCRESDDWHWSFVDGGCEGVKQVWSRSRVCRGR